MKMQLNNGIQARVLRCTTAQIKYSPLAYGMLLGSTECEFHPWEYPTPVFIWLIDPLSCTAWSGVWLRYRAQDDVLILGNLLPWVSLGKVPLTDSVSLGSPQPGFHGHYLLSSDSCMRRSHPLMQVWCKTPFVQEKQQCACNKVSTTSGQRALKLGSLKHTCREEEWDWIWTRR